MNNEPKREMPFKSLGSRLKQLREKRQESMAEVSGAVEIDITLLDNFENGQSRPSEDILLLIISHFGINEIDATKLWELAGYDPQKFSANENTIEDNLPQNIVVLPYDARVAYTDMVHVTSNESGVVMNFMQGNGSNDQPMIVSRLGMSREQAANVLEALKKTLHPIEQKALPAPKRSKQKKNTK